MRIEYYVVIEEAFSMHPTVKLHGPFHTEIEAWLWVIDLEISPNFYFVSVMPITVFNS